MTNSSLSDWEYLEYEDYWTRDGYVDLDEESEFEFDDFPTIYESMTVEEWDEIMALEDKLADLAADDAADAYLPAHGGHTHRGHSKLSGRYQEDQNERRWRKNASEHNARRPRGWKRFAQKRDPRASIRKFEFEEPRDHWKEIMDAFLEYHPELAPLYQ